MYESGGNCECCPLRQNSKEFLMTNRLETNRNMLREYALDDATNTLYWNHCIINRYVVFEKAEELKAQRCDLDNWIDERSTDREWKHYKAAYEVAIQAGIRSYKADGDINKAIAAANTAIRKCK